MHQQEIENHIKWFFNNSASAMGIRSNFCSLLSNSFGSGSHTQNEDAMIGCLQQIKRHRQIHKVLLSLSRTNYRYLQALYCEEYQDKYPLTIRVIFGSQTGLTCCLYDKTDLAKDNLKLLEELCKGRRHNNLTPEKEIELSNLQIKTKTTYTKLQEHLKVKFSSVRISK